MVLIRHNYHNNNFIQNNKFKRLEREKKNDIDFYTILINFINFIIYKLLINVEFFFQNIYLNKGFLQAV